MTTPARGVHEVAEATFVVNGERRTLTEVARQIVEETTRAQGLPLYVEDDATLLRVPDRARLRGGLASS
jgi:hypothetical protein